MMSAMKTPKTSRQGDDEIGEALNANQKILHDSTHPLLPYRDLVTEAVTAATRAYKDLSGIVRDAQIAATIVRGPALQAVRSHQDSVAEMAREHKRQVGSILEAARFADRIFQLTAINLDSVRAQLAQTSRHQEASVRTAVEQARRSMQEAIEAASLLGLSEHRRILDIFQRQPFTSAAVLATQVREFDSTFIAHIRDLASDRLAQGVDAREVAAEIKEAVESRVQQALPGTANRKGVSVWLWHVFVLLMPLYINFSLSKSSDDLANKHYEAVMQVLNQLLQNHLANSVATASADQDDQNVVLQAAAVRVERNEKSSRIATVYPNQIVHIVRICKKWAYVEYFDQIEGLPRTGWVYKKVLSKPRHYTWTQLK
jgi:hypothetical protein